MSWVQSPTRRFSAPLFALMIAAAGIAACGKESSDDPNGNGAGSSANPITGGGAGGSLPGMNVGASGGMSGGVAPGVSGSSGGGAGPAGGAAPAGSGGGAAGESGTGGAGSGGMGEGGAMPDGGMAGEPEAPCPENMAPMGDACSGPLRPGDDRLCEFMYMGRMRRYMVYAPKSYNACKPAALVMDCHGASESIEVHTGKMGFRTTSPTGYGSSWRRAVQGDNAVIVTPEGVSLMWSRTADVAFINTVDDMVSKTAKIDPEKRYISGISMGGMITAAVACDDAKRWRGMVPVAMLTNTCPQLSRPMPALIFHAPTDALTSYQGSRDLATSMARLNNCKMGPMVDAKKFGGPMSAPDPVCFETPLVPGGPNAMDPTTVPYVMCPAARPETKCDLWTECDEGVEVMMCSVNAANQEIGGHILYTNDTGLSLPALAWPFLKKNWK